MGLAKFQTDSIAQSLQCQYMSLSTVFAPNLCLSWFLIDCPISPLRGYSILLSTRPLSSIDTMLFPWNMQLQSGSSQMTFMAMSWRYFNYWDCYEFMYWTILTSSANLNIIRSVDNYFLYWKELKWKHKFWEKPKWNYMFLVYILNVWIQFSCPKNSVAAFKMPLTSRIAAQVYSRSYRTGRMG